VWSCATTGEEVALVTNSRRAPHYPNAHKKQKLKPKRTPAKKQGSKIRFNLPKGTSKFEIINQLLKKRHHRATPRRLQPPPARGPFYFAAVLKKAQTRAIPVAPRAKTTAAKTFAAPAALHLSMPGLRRSMKF
jgi:hypothetical protein